LKKTVMSRCPYCESTRSLLVGQVFCSRHADADMRALSSGTLYIRTHRLEETADHVSRLSIRLMLNGRQWYKVGGADRLVHPDNFLVIDQGQHYRTAFAGEREQEMIMVGFRPGLAQDVYRYITAGDDALLDDPWADPGTLSFSEQTHPMDRPVRSHFAQLHAVMTGLTAAGTGDGVYAIHDRLMERLIELQFGVHLQVDRLKALRRSTRQEVWRRLTNAREYAEAHHDRSVTVAEMARVACLSEHHFKRSFREAFGLPPHRYLRQVRLIQARRMLHDGTTPVHEVAHGVGFADVSAFIRAYKQLHGHTPAALHGRGTPLPVRTGPLPGGAPN
jgi:AraC family transcriptional regulator